MSANPEQIINQIKKLVDADSRSEIQLNANGGNSILVVCPPEQENLYLRTLHDLLETSKYTIIDLNALLISFVDQYQELLNESFELLKGSVLQVFKMPDGETGPDLFKHILNAIETAFLDEKIPVLVHTGALYGSGIENIHLMENVLVMKSDKPMIILYPASHDGEKLMFLNSRPSSKYRCMIAN